MGKVFLQFLVLLAMFFATWFLLGRVDYMKKLHLGKMSEKTEKKIGDLIIKSVRDREKVIENDSLTTLLNKIKTDLCDDTAMARKIQIHIVENDEVNAFSLPGNNIIVHSALIEHCDSSSELAGVLAHEMAHIRLHHVMKKLGDQIGITLLLTVASNGNGEIIREIITKLSTTAFERKLESQADVQAITYLEKARIDPAGLPDFLEKLSDLKDEVAGQPEWISTHPDTEKRVKALREQIGDTKTHYKQPLSKAEWRYMKENGTGGDGRY